MFPADRDVLRVQASRRPPARGAGGPHTAGCHLRPRHTPRRPGRHAAAAHPAWRPVDRWQRLDRDRWRRPAGWTRCRGGQQASSGRGDTHKVRLTELLSSDCRSEDRASVFCMEKSLYEWEYHVGIAQEPLCVFLMRKPAIVDFFKWTLCIRIWKWFVSDLFAVVIAFFSQHLDDYFCVGHLFDKFPQQLIVNRCHLFYLQVYAKLLLFLAKRIRCLFGKWLLGRVIVLRYEMGREPKK